VDSTLLRPEQRGRLVAELERQHRYLQKLASRMQMLRFPEEDPVNQHVLQARAVIQNLLISARASGDYVRPPARPGSR
jgi:hypothetical protein